MRALEPGLVMRTIPDKPNSKNQNIVTMLIVLAVFLRNMWQYLPTNDLRGMIYMGLFAAWGFSVRQRIIQVQVRRYLTAISILMFFWVMTRSLKYMFFSYTHLGRYCWYLYYFPMLFIPLLVLFVAMSLGKPEDFRLPKWTNGIFLVSAVLFALVLTNDFHQLTFGFPKGVLFIENNDYSHELVYFFSVGWMAICAVAALAVMISKCRIPGKKKWIWVPCVPVLLLVLYAVLYLTAWDYVKPIAGDMTVVSCLLVTAALESCIQCGLIQSNTHYDELFRNSSVCAQITDDNHNIMLSSINPQPSSDNIRFCNAPIKGGHVIWSEDVSELTAALEELAEKQEDLKEENAILRENYKTELRIQQLAEKNRLYDKMHRQTAQQTTLLGNLLRQFEAAKDEAQRKKLLQKMTVVGVYLKRRNNLIFIGEQNQMMHSDELSLCFDETMDNLKLSGIECGCYIAFQHELPADTAMTLYDFYEKVLEASYDSLRAILIRICENADYTMISLDVSCDANLFALQSETVSVSFECDEGYSLVLSVPKGGAKQ